MSNLTHWTADEIKDLERFNWTPRKSWFARLTAAIATTFWS